MDNITFVEIERIGGEIETYAVIEREDGSKVSMPKSIYDEQQANADKGTIS